MVAWVGIVWTLPDMDLKFWTCVAPTERECVRDMAMHLLRNHYVDARLAHDRLEIDADCEQLHRFDMLDDTICRRISTRAELDDLCVRAGEDNFRSLCCQAGWGFEVFEHAV